jgi:hypothetical protein
VTGDDELASFELRIVLVNPRRLLVQSQPTIRAPGVLIAHFVRLSRKSDAALRESEEMGEILGLCRRYPGMTVPDEMETLHRRPLVQDYVETHISMSEKRLVSYPGVSAA